jgi:hypothetical protein
VAADGHKRTVREALGIATHGPGNADSGRARDGADPGAGPGQAADTLNRALDTILARAQPAQPA